jgi:hypothetical protein
VGLFGRRQRGRHAGDDLAEESERESYSGEIYDGSDVVDGGADYDEYDDEAGP